jgi:hypothetical protein
MPFCRVYKRMMGLEPTTFCMASRCSSQLSYIRATASIAPVSRLLGLAGPSGFWPKVAL